MNIKEDKMEPFTKEAKCPKCGYGLISIKYCKGGTGGLSCITGFYYTANREHLDKTCDKCGFSWPEETMDKEG